MEDHLLKARYYRDQATNMRTLAVNEDNLEVKRALIYLAETYEAAWLNVVNVAKQHQDQGVLNFNPR